MTKENVWGFIASGIYQETGVRSPSLFQLGTPEPHSRTFSTPPLHLHVKLEQRAEHLTNGHEQAEECETTPTA